MIFNYKLEIDDYQTHLLYTISKSDSAIKTRAKIRLMISIFLVILACISFGNHSFGQGIYLLFLSVLAFYLMPLFTRWSYNRTYLKQVKKYYNDRISEPTTFEIKKDSIHISDTHGESKLLFSDIEEINELANYYFLKTKNGQSIILPLYSIETSENLNSELTNFAHEFSINWNNEVNWIWK